MIRQGVFKLGRNLLLVVAGLAAVAYLGVLSYLYVNQRHMLYMQVQGHETPDIKGVPIQDLSLKTPDGETLQAWYEPPKPGMPVILYLHGNAASLEKGKWRYIRMHKQGVGYLALAYRGYSGSTGVATWLATQRPARALILEAPFTAASDVGAEEYPYIPVSLLMKDKFLSRERIKDVHIPLLIAHGDKDTVVPFAQGERLFALANEPKVFVRMHGSEHNTLTRDGIYLFYWKFLNLPETDVDPALVIAK